MQSLLGYDQQLLSRPSSRAGLEDGTRADTTSDARSQKLMLRLLGAFGLTFQGRPVNVSMASQRLLALLALRDQPLQRAHVSGILWPDYREDRAAANLRSALNRLPLGSGVLVATRGRQITLSRQVAVDLREIYGQVRRVFDQSDGVLELLLVRDQLTVDLLPDWYDEWAVAEQEHYGEIRLRALEKLSEGLLAAGRTAAAVETSLAAVAADPLRETTQRLLISSYLAEGNRAKALCHFRKFRSQLRHELDLEPSPALTSLIRDHHSD